MSMFGDIAIEGYIEELEKILNDKKLNAYEKIAKLKWKLKDDKKACKDGWF